MAEGYGSDWTMTTRLARLSDIQVVKAGRKMDVTPAGPALPGITHHHAEVNGTRLHYVAAGDSGPAGPRVSRDLVGLPQAHPAAHGQPPGLRRRPARLRRLRQRARRVRQRDVSRRTAPSHRAAWR